jgi:hypothetical protein
LIYDGEGIHDGEMDASALAPALLAIAELFDAADTTINGSETVVSTRVKAGFRKGSFEVLFSIEQHVIDAAVGILPTLHLIGADLLIATVLGNLKSKIKERIGESASDTVVGLFILAEESQILNTIRARLSMSSIPVIIARSMWINEPLSYTKAERQ